MRDNHSIDDQFRQALAHAELDPPPRVLAGVLAAQRSKRRRRFFLLWIALALLGTGVGTALYLGISSRGSEMVATTKEATAEETKDKDQELHEVSQAAGVPFVSNGEQGAVPVEAKKEVNASGAELEGAKPSVSESKSLIKEDELKEASANRDQGTASRSRTVLGGGGQVIPTVAQSKPFLLSTEQVLPDEELEEARLQAIPEEDASENATTDLTVALLELRFSYMDDQAPTAVLETTPIYSYVLHKGEWWLGPTAGILVSRQRWQGDDQELVGRIQDNSLRGHNLAWALAAGRTWRSGWGFSTGLMVEQGSMQRQLLDRLVLVEREVETYVVTLDAMVFSSVTDTLVTTTITETEYKGQMKRTVLRLPLAMHWHGNRGPWLYGGQLGFALEYSRRSGGPVLVRDVNDARITPVMDESGIANDRSPLALLATAGLEGGYQLHEHWSLWAGPVAFKGLTALQDKPAVFALPDSWGLQMRLVHHLYRNRTR